MPLANNPSFVADPIHPAQALRRRQEGGGEVHIPCAYFRPSFRVESRICDRAIIITMNDARICGGSGGRTWGIVLDRLQIVALLLPLGQVNLLPDVFS